MEPLEVDDETDRIYSVDLVGKKNRGNYEASGWHTRTVQYYNASLKKYHLLFEDGSSDLFKRLRRWKTTGP